MNDQLVIGLVVGHSGLLMATLGDPLGKRLMPPDG